MGKHKAQWVAGLALAGFALTAPSMATAALDPTNQCEVSKVKAAGKYGECVANVNAKAIKATTAVDVEKLAKCDAKVGAGFDKAEEKAIGACLVAGDESNINAIVDACMSTVINSLGGVPGPGGDQAKCQSNKLKSAGKYSGCRYKALAKAIKGGVSPDFTACEAKFSDKWADLDAGTCSTSADYAAIKTAIDDCYTVVAGTLHPITEYVETFESLDAMNAGALSAAGFNVYINVFDGTMSPLYGYGFPAPNPGDGPSAIVTGQGGVDQGNQQLSIYSHYGNPDHGAGNWIESNVYRERTVVAGDVGRTITFSADAKRGNIGGITTAVMFIKTLDPLNGYAMTNFLPVYTTNLPISWSTLSISIDITPALSGQIIQFGFATTATAYDPSGNYYDNLVISSVPTP